MDNLYPDDQSLYHVYIDKRIAYTGDITDYRTLEQIANATYPHLATHGDITDEFTPVAPGVVNVRFCNQVWADDVEQVLDLHLDDYPGTTSEIVEVTHWYTLADVTDMVFYNVAA